MDVSDPHFEHFAQCPTAVFERMMAIRQLVIKLAPHATPVISYQMPAFKLKTMIVYFAAFKHHIGLYPPVHDPALLEALKPYLGPKNNLKFPHDAPLPLNLIEAVIEARIRVAS